MIRRPLLLLAAVAVVVPAALAASAEAPRLPAATPLPTWTTNGDVDAILPVGNRVYLAGSFSALGPPVGSLLALRTRDGSVDGGFPRLSGGDVEVTAADGHGGWFLGGSFDYAAGVHCSYLVHVEASGRLDRRWCPRPNGTVGLLARAGGTLYLAGSFTRVGQASRKGLAAVRVDTGRPTAWRPAPPRDGSASALAAAPGRVFVGGYFTSWGGRHANGIVALDATTGRPLRWNARLDRSTCSTREPCIVLVSAIAVEGRSVYVAGNFDLAGGNRRVALAALDARTARPLRWRADLDREALHLFEETALYGAGSTVYVIGGFSRIGGADRPGIAALDARTGAVTRWKPTLRGTATAVAVAGSRVVVPYVTDEGAGVRAFDRASGRTIWAKTDFCCEGGFGSAVAAGGRVLITSSIAVRNRYVNDGLAVFDPTTRKMLPWHPRIKGFVAALAEADNTLYVAGEFTNINGQGRNGMAAFDLQSGKLLPWNPNVNGYVYSIAVTDSTVYAAGRFSSVGGRPRVGLAAVDATTGAVSDWDPRPRPEGWDVLALAARGSTIYIAGGFSAIGGQARTNLAAVDAETGAATAWDPAPDGFVSDVALAPQSLFIAGRFSHVRGAARSGLADVDLATGQPTAFDPEAGVELEYDGFAPLDVAGQLLIVGRGDYAYQDRPMLTALDATSGRLLDWEPTAAKSIVNALAHDSRHLYVGGKLPLDGSSGFVAFAW